MTSFDKRPREVKAFLDRFVMQQHDAKKALAVALCDHYNHVRRCVADESEERQHLRHYVKPNVLLLGPSGVGKTHLVRTLAKLIGVPFVKVDATKFSATGYVGGDVEEPLRSVVAAADGDVRLAEYGIVYVDEVDKLSARPGGELAPRVGLHGRWRDGQHARRADGPPEAHGGRGGVAARGHGPPLGTPTAILVVIVSEHRLRAEGAAAAAATRGMTRPRATSASATRTTAGA